MMERLRKDFTTITLALMVVAVALNLVLGNIVYSLKIPLLYLDTIGTVLVGLLCGPLAGALTGIFTSLGWLFTVPDYVAYMPVGAMIGLLAGIFGQLGWYRRVLGPGPRVVLIAAVGLTAGIAIGLFASGIWGSSVGRVVGVVVGLIVALLLFLWKGAPTLWMVGGFITALTGAILSAPINAYLYGGVTGSGTDLLVAAFRAGGASILQASFLQGLVTESFDKVSNYLIVWAIVQALPARFLARFPRYENVRPG